VKEPDPKLFIYVGAIAAIARFFMIHPYLPDFGPLENAMIGSIPLGNAKLPYRYVLIFATVVMGYGFYKLKAPRGRPRTVPRPARTGKEPRKPGYRPGRLQPQ
jgi:hypothetical protein